MWEGPRVGACVYGIFFWLKKIWDKLWGRGVDGKKNKTGGN